MKNRKNRYLALPAPAECHVRTVQRLNRLSSLPEPLEPRLFMSTTALAVPTTISATPLSATSVKVSWVDTDTKDTGYNVLRSSSGSNFTQVAHLPSRTITSFTDTTVTANKSYTYKVDAISTSAASSPSTTATAKTPMTTPTGVTATATDGTHVTLTWTDTDTTATGYNVLKSTDGVHYTQFATLTSRTDQSTTDSTVTSGKSFKYEVQAYKTGNTSVTTAPVTVITPLAAPSGLAATTVSSNSIHINWTNNDPSATGYLVMRSTDNSHFSQVSKLTTASVTSFDDTTVLPYTMYYYQVEATTTAATSAASNTASATTPLAVPSGVTGVATPNSVAIKWTDKDAAAQGYEILRSMGAGSFSQVGSISSSNTVAWTDTSVSSNQSYTYEVEAVHGNSTSAASTPVLVTTPLIAPSALTTTVISGGGVQLNWIDNDSSATGYTVYKSTDGVHFTPFNALSSSTAATFTDTAVSTGHAYSYAVQATSGRNLSAVTTPSRAVTPLVAPSGLSATSSSATSIALAWTDHDSSAAGYNVLRSSDGTTYVNIGTVNTATATSFTDASVSADHTYSYKVQAVNAVALSSVSNSASAVTPMMAPAGLTASVAGAWINLTWTDKDSSATGYSVLRSTDGINFTQLATLNTAGASSFADTTVMTGQKYYYQVQATNGAAASMSSNTANATVIAASTSSVAVTTRYSDELVITATGSNDTVSISETSGTLTIVADGQTSTDVVPAAGVFLYTRGGADGISIAQTVVAPVTVETVDGAVTDISSAGTDVTAWIDSTDIYTGTGTVHSIGSFAGGVSKATGASLAKPRDAGTTTKLVESLFGTGPVAGDANQGGVGDCYLLSSLAAIANTNPSIIEQSAVDMGDGTYTVEYYSGNTPTFVRVSNDISTGNYWGYQNSRPGANHSMWAVIMEKAYAYFRTGANTYASLDAGWMGDVYSNLHVANSSFAPSSLSESALYTMLSTDLASGKAVTLGTNNAPGLVSGHAYTLISASIDNNGVTHYVVRNPWGVSGDSLEDANGYATLTYSQMIANFIDGCQAI